MMMREPDAPAGISPAKKAHCQHTSSPFKSRGREGGRLTGGIGVHHARAAPLLERPAHALHRLGAQAADDLGHDDGGARAIAQGAAQPGRRPQVVRGEPRVRHDHVRRRRAGGQRGEEVGLQ
jgi:hypothetical protein